MSVSVHVGPRAYAIGYSEFFGAFFSTIYVRLENGILGSRFPVVMTELATGSLSAGRAGPARSELSEIRRELAGLSPELLAWDHADPAAKPPWGDNVSTDISSLGDYFITANGRDLFEVLDDALLDAERSNLGASIG